MTRLRSLAAFALPAFATLVLAACAATAAATRGWAWPVLVTPIPDE